jgi:hypothetical protein
VPSARRLKRESTIAPRKDDVAGHGADGAWIVLMGTRQKRGSRLHAGLNERLDRCGRIVGDDGEAESAGTRIDIFGVPAAWVSLAAVLPSTRAVTEIVPRGSPGSNEPT